MASRGRLFWLQKEVYEKFGFVDIFIDMYFRGYLLVYIRANK